MVKIELVEGFNAYVGASGWAVLPQWDKHGAQLVGVATIWLPGGVRISVKGNPSDIAKKIEADSRGPNPFGGLISPGGTN